MQSVTDLQSLLPARRWRSCPVRATHTGSAPVGTATSSGFAPVGNRQPGPAVAHPDAPRRYSLPVRSAAPAERNFDQQAIPDVLLSRACGCPGRAARAATETHSIAGGPRAPPAPLPDGHVLGRASPHALHPAPRSRSATRRDATPPAGGITPVVLLPV